METNETILTTFKAPLYIAWEITHLCNAKCYHCYSNSSPEADCSHDLSTEEALSVIDQLTDIGLLILAFSGGEPMLRRDWKILVEHAVKRGLAVNIGTNGSTVTEESADFIKQIGVKSVTVSLDSHKSKIHDNFRQCRGLYECAINAIRLLVERKIRVVVGFTPTQLNWKNGTHVIKLAYKLGADAVNLSEYVPAGRGSIGLALRPKKLRNLLVKWIHLRERYHNKIDIIWHDCRVGLLVPKKDQRKYVGCGAGRLLARIYPNGNVTPCVFLPIPIGSFRHETFREMWNNSRVLKQFRDRNGQISGNCGDCEYLMSCGGCRAVAYAYSGGNPFAGDSHCWVKKELDNEIIPLYKGESLPI